MKQMAKGRDRLLRRMSAAVELEWKWGANGVTLWRQNYSRAKKANFW